MKQIMSLTDNARQRFEIPLDNGDLVDFYLYYYPTQYSWFFDFTYKNYTNNGNRVVLTPNALRHLKNIIPFGIAFMADGFVEPFQLDDFATQRIGMYVLNQEEVQEIESTIYDK
jgi:hypothetical protein